MDEIKERIAGMVKFLDLFVPSETSPHMLKDVLLTEVNILAAIISDLDIIVNGE